MTDAQIRHIKELITSLASLDKPDFGLSATMSGTDFAPIQGQEHAEAFLLTDHGLRRSTTLKDLVAIGPDALPFLLDALDNKTPTRVVIKHGGHFGGMWFAQELQTNPVNPAERGVPKKPADFDLPGQNVDTYTIKVGDVCFVAIGQIVGRRYEAVRYQPTACIVLNSPTNDATLCARVRGIWKSDNPQWKLFDSLCADYATIGIYNGKNLDGWYEGSEFQCAAALRMLFYFPRESAPLLVSRLEKLNVAKDAKLDDFERRCVANGVRSDYFIDAVAWSSDSAVRAALTGVFNRAEDIDSLMAALPAVDDKESIRRRLTAQLTALPADDAGPYGDANQLLAALLRRVPEAARAMFDHYLQHPTADRRHTVCATLRGVNVPWDVDLLLSMLSDTRTFGWSYAEVPGQDEPRLPIRVCDEAAVTLSQNHPAVKFTLAGKYADLDRQIAAIRTAFANKK